MTDTFNAVQIPLYDGGRSSARNLAAFRADPIAFLRAAASSGDSAISFKIGSTSLVLLNDPELVEQVLVTDQELYGKGPGLLRARSVLGDGLLTVDGARHRERRRRLQPAFHKSAVAAHLAEMVRCEREVVQEWNDGDVLDMHREMAKITLGVAAATLFGSNRRPDVLQITEAVSTALRSVYGRLSSEPAGTGHAGCPERAAAARCVLENSAIDLLKGYRASKIPMLPALLADDVADGISETAALDEAVTFLVAGHESVANALTWTWTLLAQNPEWERTFHREIDAEGDRALDSLATLGSLDVSRRILTESMRLYPPAWMVSRTALTTVHLGPYGPLPAGTVVIAAQCVAHHDARFYRDPDRFDPDRWLLERPRYSYFPFGGGPRLCIGERFAWTELLTALVVIGREWKFRLVDGNAPVPDAVVTLRPRGGAPMRLERRLHHTL